MKKQILYFPVPPTLNEQIDEARGNKFKNARTKSSWTNDILIECRSQNSISFGDDRVWIDFVWSLKSRAIDPCDNLVASLKYIMDGLVLAEVIKNDNGTIIQDPIIHWRKYGDKKNKIKENSVMVTISNQPHFLFERMVEFRERLLQIAI